MNVRGAILGQEALASPPPPGGPASRKLMAFPWPLHRLSPDVPAARRRRWPGAHIAIWTAVLAGLAFFLTAQLQSKPASPPVTAEYPRHVAAATIQRLEEEQAYLKGRISELRSQIARQQQQAAAARSSLREISQALESQRLAAGMVPLKGPGLRIVTDDTTLKSLPPNEDPNKYIVHEYELRDILNLLWRAGAEAVAINGERIVANTSIYCVGTTIMINNTRMSPPYELLVLGDPTALEAALSDPGALRSFKEAVKRYGLVFQISKQKEVTVPAYNGGFNIKYAQTGAERR